MSREEKQANYVNGEGVGVLSWGRFKVALRLFEALDIDDEDNPDFAYALYRMPLEKLQGLHPDDAIEEVRRFSSEASGTLVIDCSAALMRDMAAIEAAQVKLQGAGKPPAGEGQSQATRGPSSAAH